MAVGTAHGADGESAARARRWTLLRWLGRSFHGLTWVVTVAFAALIAAIVALLLSGAWSSLGAYGLGFLTSSNWNTTQNLYGAAPAIVGTLLTSGLALLIAVPIALAVAIFLADVAPPWLRQPLAYVLDLSAAVPSVVYGFWAFIVLIPLMRTTIEPGLARTTGGGWPFSGTILGTDVLTATIVLVIMIIPTIAALSREALLAVPSVHRESALSLGATRWESTRLGVLRSARSGIMAGVIFGLGRALGETIAIAMVIGNIYILPGTLFSPGATLASEIVNTFPDAVPGLNRSAIIELALLLLLITIAVNVVARWLVRRASGPIEPDRPEAGGRQARARRSRALAVASRNADATGTGVDLAPWRQRALERSARRRRQRRYVEWAVIIVAAACVLAALAPFASVLVTAADRGGSLVVRPTFYTSLPPLGCNPEPGITCAVGGIGPEIQGTLIMLGIGSLIAIPGGLLVGIYLAEYGRGRFGRAVSFFADVMTGIPTIIIGVFVFTLFLYVDHDATLSALSGGVGLGVLMLPIAARATEVALGTVSAAVRESALALGFPRHRVTLRVVLGASRGALVTGLLLAASRAAGDTAILLLTAGGSSFWCTNLSSECAAMTPFIYDNFSSNYANLQAAAWGAALVLLAIMLVIALAARMAVAARRATSDGE